MRIPEAEFFAEVAECLIARDVTMEFIAGHEAACDVFEKKDLTYYNLHQRVRAAVDISDMNANSKDSIDIQSRFGIDNIRNIYLREKLHFGRFNEQKMLNKTRVYLNVMDAILRESQPDAVVQETGDFVAPNCLYHAARSRNIHHIFIEPGMFPNRIVFALDSFYADIPSDLTRAPRSAEELSFADSFIQDYHNNRLTRVPTKDKTFIKHMHCRDVVCFSNFKKLTRKLFHKYIARKAEEYNAIGHHCISHIGRVFHRKRLNPLYLHALPEEPFLYYPLHVPLDLQLTTRCREYLDQLSLIDYLATCVPNGYLLLVKEHPASVGNYNSGRIRGILKRHPHVRLVHPFVNSFDIIERSESVVTINSKVGVEAVAQCKPVVVLGPTFYRGRGLTLDVEAPKDVPEAIRQALAGKKLDQEKVRDFLALVYRWSWPGELFDRAPENIRVFSDSLWQYMNAQNLC